MFILPVAIDLFRFGLDYTVLCMWGTGKLQQKVVKTVQ